MEEIRKNKNLLIIFVFFGVSLLFVAALTVTGYLQSGVTEAVSLILVLTAALALISKKNPDKTMAQNLYRYRYLIAGIAFVILVAFELHGSSIGVWETVLENGGVESSKIIGIYRPIRSDEWAVNMPMMLSQYANKTGAFPYFSDTIRGTVTDAFIVYGQPAWDIAVLFRPFHWGYLIFSAGRGLSFFWFGRLFALFFVTLEFCMLITKGNKRISLAAALLISFAPIVQWWFAINGLVEMLVFGQLAVLLFYRYMKTDKIGTRILYAAIIAICGGGYVLTFYPAWQIPLFYVFAGLALWVILDNFKKKLFSVKDLIPLAVFLFFFAGGMVYIFSKSASTISAVMNTAYPGARLETGGHQGTRLIQYVSNLFFPYRDIGLVTNVCEEAVFFDFFPVGILLSFYVIFKQKKKDKLLIILLIEALFLGLWCTVEWPEWLAKITFLSNVQAARGHLAFGLVNILLLVRSTTLFKASVKAPAAVALSTVLAGFLTALVYKRMQSYYNTYLLIVSFIVLFVLFILIFLIQKRKVQTVFCVSCAVLALVMGATVNPVQQGVQALTHQPIVLETEKIANENDGLWIVEGMDLPFTNITLAAGAPTINSTNVYPNLELWRKLDASGEYEDIYNRYAHIYIDIIAEGETLFTLNGLDNFTVSLNILDLQLLNVRYILSNNHALEEFSNDNLILSKISEAQGLCIYEVVYSKTE